MNSVPLLKLDCQLQFVKLPSYCQISTRPYSRETYESEASAETVIRYRKVLDASGKETIETNARLVRWSDGSSQLLIGGTEALAVTAQVRPCIAFNLFSSCFVS